MPSSDNFCQPIGAHLSIAGGLHKALLKARALGCSALQIFTKNGNTWKERNLTPDEIQRFREVSQDTGIFEIAAHTSYLINIASPDRGKLDMSRDALVQEIVRADQLKIPYVVLHPGFHMGAGENAGMDQIADIIRQVFSSMGDIKTRLLLETTAGQGSGIGHRFDQLAAILERVGNPRRTGVCLDTCHIFGAGYDFRNRRTYEETIGQFKATIGLENLYLIHLNDSKRELGSRIDRHEHIGRGEIGENGFKLLMQDNRLAKVPKILETPKGKTDEMDTVNLKLLKRLAGEPRFVVHSS